MYRSYQSISTSQDALDMLKKGNERYLSGDLSDKSDYAAEREVLSRGQHPYAIVLACSDSRTPPEIFFDQKLGDLFTIRNAGNIADDSAIGSIEFAVSVLKVPLITVVGHNECGAVLAAYQNIGASGKLKVVLDSIKPALEGSKDENEAINANIINTVNKIKENNVVKEHHTAVLGAHYNIKTGVVNWVV